MPGTVTGLGTGFETSTIPTWHAECAKAHSRGFAVFIEVRLHSPFDRETLQCKDLALTSSIASRRRL